jgi:hypothetical protein
VRPCFTYVRRVVPDLAVLLRQPYGVSQKLLGSVEVPLPVGHARRPRFSVPDWRWEKNSRERHLKISLGEAVGLTSEFVYVAKKTGTESRWTSYFYAPR